MSWIARPGVAGTAVLRRSALLEGREPRPAQIGTLNLPLDERLAVIEAPTGSGKTEAALIWASRLVEAGASRWVIFRRPNEIGCH